MDLTWGEDFEVLAEVARSVFISDSTFVERKTELTYHDQLRQLVELDWLQLSDPTRSAEFATDLGSIAGIFVEMGNALIKNPLQPLTMVRDIALLISTARATNLAKEVGDGSCSILPVLYDSRWNHAQPTFAGTVLSGTALGVPYADEADGFLVQALRGDETVVLVVDADRTDIQVTPNLGEYSLFAVTFDAIPVAEDDVLVCGTEAERILKQAELRAAVLLAAQVYGAGARLQDMVVGFAQQRHQFGGPIGRFQAVQYLCTDLAIGVHLTSAFARNAAHAVETGIQPDLHVALMRRQAARTAQEMVHKAHEIYAGMGFMIESDVHLFTKAAKKWQFDLAADDFHDRTIVSCLDSATTPEVTA